MPKIAKSKRPEAERATVHYLREVCDCVITRRFPRSSPRFDKKTGKVTFGAAVDMFASDCIGKRADGTWVCAQATAGGNEALRTRRRKSEQIPWHPDDTVLVLQLTSTPDPAHAARKNWFFRVHRFACRGEMTLTARRWLDVEAHPVPKEWFKAWKEPEELVSGDGRAADETNSGMAGTETAAPPDSSEVAPEKCETCADTGWDGDNGPGRNGNNEFVPCDQCTPFERAVRKGRTIQAR